MKRKLIGKTNDRNRFQSETAEETVRVRGPRFAEAPQERLLPGHRRDRIRVQGEVPDHGNAVKRLRFPGLTKCFYRSDTQS